MSLFNYLCCPACKKNLAKKGDSLSCGSCRMDYEIRSGIPILVDLASLPKHLLGQIEYFQKEDEQRSDYRLEPWQRRYIDNFLRYGKPKPGGLVIDNATGSGYMTVELARRGFRVVATDLTFKELVKLKNNLNDLRLAKNVFLICCDSQRLPIGSGIADGLVANAILEHLPDESRAIEEIARVVKSGSPVMVAMPIAYHLLLLLLWLPNIIHDRRIGHLRRYDRQSIIRKFRGFKEIKTYYTGHVVKIFCLFLLLITKMKFWEAWGEKADMTFEHIPYGGSNIVSILKKL